MWFITTTCFVWIERFENWFEGLGSENERTLIFPLHWKWMNIYARRKVDNPKEPLERFRTAVELVEVFNKPRTEKG